MTTRADTPHTPSLSQLLASLGASAAFATHFSIEANPQLHVEGVGDVQLPVSIHTAHRLCAVAQPAHHGYKDETRLDRRVRDTWEIAAAQLRFDSPQWPAALAGALDRIRRDLGLSRDIQLDAQLHNLLIYAPGQFFATHQDSEKADGMLGTMVVTLPSRFSGGEFVISHQGQTLRSSGSVGQLGVIAFYADCLHEVRAVKEGYRVVLTYNLVARDGAQVEHVSPQEIAALADAVRDFWRMPAGPRWAGDRAAEPPDRLVYLLDHEYTPSGLSWNHLKGADSARVAALRQVARQLDAEIFLTLADVHETWSAEEDYQTLGRRQYADDDDDDDDDDDLTDGGADEPELIELIESNIELRHWIAADGSRVESENNGVDYDELCFTRDSSDCTPFESEYEGYTGNAGATLDRWYHRAAVVMWPRERAFVIRARLSPRWAIEQIADRLAHGDAAQARQWSQALLPFWKGAAGRFDGGSLLGPTLAVCAALDDAPTAAGLLAPFSLEHLAPDMSPSLLRLLERHGLDWCVERLNAWSEMRGLQFDAHLGWLAQTLPALARDWSHAAGVDGVALAAVLAQQRWAGLQRYIAKMQADTYSKHSAKQRALAATSAALLGLIRASHGARDPQLVQQVIDALLSDQLPVETPLGVLRAASMDAPDAAGLGLLPVHAHCVQTLSTRLAQPERAANDWSITPPADCAQIPELGEALLRFLSSPTQQRLEWPLAEAKRQVIHQFIDRHELPVKHETRRSGRPYTLVLDKTPALFEHEAAQRKYWVSELAWLRGQSFPNEV
jgi:hypothetical protein